MKHCDDQMRLIKKRESYLKSLKAIQDQQDALQVISADLEAVSSDEGRSLEPAEVDLALAKHEDQRAALQIQVWPLAQFHSFCS